MRAATNGQRGQVAGCSGVACMCAKSPVLLSLALLLSSCVPLDKQLNLSELQIFHLSSGDSTTQKCV